MRECVEKKWESPREIIVIMDFKMKFQPQYYRQKHTEHYGKRGSSWHGTLVICYVYDPVEKKAVRVNV